jgi:hypothetical protein
MVSQQDHSPRRRAWLRARAKAERLGTLPEPLFDDDAIYAVRSSYGSLYFVRRNEQSTAYTCSCPAGEQQITCYDAASVAGLPEEVQRRAAFRAARTAEQAPA